jgi:predicted oxidoreductase
MFFGGLLIDTKMRVLDKEHRPVPGLLAVGNVSGGLYGVDYPLLLSGNSHGRALTWARAAAETLFNSETLS